MVIGLLKPLQVYADIRAARDSIGVIDGFCTLLHIWIVGAGYLSAQCLNLFLMGVISWNSSQAFNLRAIGLLSLVSQRYIAKVEQINLHGTGIGEDNEFFRGFPLTKETVDFVLDKSIFPVWPLVCITEYQDDLIPVALILVLKPGRYVGRTLGIDGRETVGIVPQIQGDQTIEVMIILVPFTNDTDSVLSPNGGSVLMIDSPPEGYQTDRARAMRRKRLPDIWPPDQMCLWFCSHWR